VTGDFDEDGVLDLAVACGSGQVAVLWGSPAQEFPTEASAPRILISVGAGASAIAASDFNPNGVTASRSPSTPA
jgi:hypothetical protein